MCKISHTVTLSRSPKQKIEIISCYRVHQNKLKGSVVVLYTCIDMLFGKSRTDLVNRE